MGIEPKVSHCGNWSGNEQMENKTTLLIVEGAGTLSPRRSPLRSRSNLSRNLTFCRGESGGGATGSLPRRHGNGASSPSFKTVCGDGLPRIKTGYTSLSDLTVTVPSSASFMRSDSFGTTATTNSPRTPLRDALVEKAVRAYLQPSESFQARNRRSRWGVCLFTNNFFSNIVAKFASSIPNPLKFFCCTLNWIGLYFTRTEVTSSWN